jgi:hypothetical protein
MLRLINHGRKSFLSFENKLSKSPYDFLAENR